MIKLLDKNYKGKYSDSPWRKDEWMFPNWKKEKAQEKKKGTGTEISQTKLRNIVSVRGVSGKGKNRKIFEDITDKIFSDLMKI